MSDTENFNLVHYITDILICKQVKGSFLKIWEMGYNTGVFYVTDRKQSNGQKKEEG